MAEQTKKKSTKAGRRTAKCSMYRETNRRLRNKARKLVKVLKRNPMCRTSLFALHRIAKEWPSYLKGFDLKKALEAGQSKALASFRRSDSCARCTDDHMARLQANQRMHDLASSFPELKTQFGNIAAKA